VVLLTVGVPLLLMFGCIFSGCNKDKATEQTAARDSNDWKKLRGICEKGADKKNTADLIEKEFCKKKNKKECNAQRMKLVDDTAVAVNTLLTETRMTGCEDKKTVAKLETAARLLRSRRRARLCFERNEHAFTEVKETPVLKKQFEELKKLNQDKDLKEDITKMGKGALKKEINEYMQLASGNIELYLKLSSPPTEEKTDFHFRETHEIIEEKKEQKRSKPVHLALE